MSIASKTLKKDLSARIELYLHYSTQFLIVRGGTAQRYHWYEIDKLPNEELKNHLENNRRQSAFSWVNNAGMWEFVICTKAIRIHNFGDNWQKLFTTNLGVVRQWRKCHIKKLETFKNDQSAVIFYSDSFNWQCALCTEYSCNSSNPHFVQDRSIKLSLNSYVVYLLKSNSNWSTYEYCFCYHNSTPCLIRNTRETPRAMRNCVE
jgi:hypothetical protein